MSEEELNEIESLDIVLNDVDDLDMGLEVISYKARVCIQELSKVVMEQSSQLQAYKDKEDKLREYCEARLEIAKNDCVPARSFTLQDILQILNEGSDKE